MKHRWMTPDITLLFTRFCSLSFSKQALTYIYSPIYTLHACIKIRVASFFSSQTTSLFCNSHTIQQMDLKSCSSLKYLRKNVGKYFEIFLGLKHSYV
jgi:hypothetical protein